MKHVHPKIVVRSETDADAGAISEVTVAAFKTLKISQHTEQSIVEALRAAKALTVSLVAEVDGRRPLPAGDREGELKRREADHDRSDGNRDLK